MSDKNLGKITWFDLTVPDAARVLWQNLPSAETIPGG